MAWHRWLRQRQHDRDRRVVAARRRARDQQLVDQLLAHHVGKDDDRLPDLLVSPELDLGIPQVLIRRFNGYLITTGKAMSDDPSAP